MTKVSAAEFADFLEKRCKAKDGYIMGATGQNPKTLSAWWFNQYSGSQYTRAIYWKNHAERVWDCNGLAEGYYKEKTGKNINTRARNNYASWCEVKGTGMIPPDKRVRGAAVFWGSSAKEITHVAFLVRPVREDEPSGDWVMVEARGVNYGVVETRLIQRKSAYWGHMTRYFDYGDKSAESSGNSEKVQNASGAHVTGGCVNIRTGPGTNFPVLEVAGKGDRLTVLTSDGWVPILFDGNAAWISEKYVDMGV